MTASAAVVVIAAAVHIAASAGRTKLPSSAAEGPVGLPMGSQAAAKDCSETAPVAEHTAVVEVPSETPADFENFVQSVAEAASEEGTDSSCQSGVQRLLIAAAQSSEAEGPLLISAVAVDPVPPIHRTPYSLAAVSSPPSDHSTQNCS